MAKSKKKKKAAPSIAKRLEITKSYFDRYSAVARKILQVLDLDPALFDRFTKRQKTYMMLLKSELPRVKVRPGDSIPRHYIKKVQQDVYDFIKIYPVNDNDELNLSFMDLLTYGISFTFYAMLKDKTDGEVENKEIYHQIAEKADQAFNGFENNIMMVMWQYMNFVLSGMSKLNFRVYGFEWHWENNYSSYNTGVSIYITATVPRMIHFVYNDRPRPAYQAICGQYLTGEPKAITIPYNQIIEDSNQTHPLEVYIQNHAFTRIKERVDVLSAALRTACLNSSLLDGNTLTLNNGQCVLKMVEKSTGTLGYLPFTIIKDKLFVLTFLPICSQNAPEGKKLQEILGISRKETEYLGMDKLSFFMDTDFEAIPRLKEAVIESGLWHLTKLNPPDSYQPQHHMTTATLAHFFEKEHTPDEVLREIEEKY